jgi:hypothetical protein
MKMIMKTMLTISSLLIRALAILLMLTLLAPLAYFAWRAGRPMSLPKFHELTYYQLMTKRRQAYDQLARSYQAGHPYLKVKAGICFDTELGIEIIGAVPNSGFYTLAAVFPSLKKYVNPQDAQRGYIPENVSATNFLPAWWVTFEKFVWGLIENAPHGPVAYCRIAFR